MHLDPAAARRSGSRSTARSRRSTCRRTPSTSSTSASRARCSRSSGGARSSSGRRSFCRRTTTQTRASRIRSTTSRAISPLEAPGRIRGERARRRRNATEREKERARRREEFTKAWLSDGFPRMLFVHVPAPDALLRRLLRDRLAQQRPVRPGDHDGAHPVHREALPRDPAAVGADPLRRIDGRLGVARAPDLSPRLFRRHVLLLPGPRRLPLLRDGQHLRVGQRLVPQGRVAQDRRSRASATRTASSSRR